MTHRTIGTASVFPIGLGMMPLATRDAADRAERTVHAALDAGVTLIDTADAYGPDETTVGFNERQVAAGPRQLRRRHVRRAGRHQGRPHPDRGEAAGA